MKDDDTDGGMLSGTFLGLRTDMWRRPIAMHSIIFPPFYYYFFFSAQQTVGTVNARYLRNGPTQIHRSYRKLLSHTPAQNGGKSFKIWKRWSGETPPKNKMNVKNLNCYQNIWKFFIVKNYIHKRNYIHKLGPPPGSSTRLFHFVALANMLIPMGVSVQLPLAIHRTGQGREGNLKLPVRFSGNFCMRTDRSVFQIQMELICYTSEHKFWWFP